MELLILSKLKWDLTAVTAYDYLDLMMNTLQRADNAAAVHQSPQQENLLSSNSSSSSQSQQQRQSDPLPSDGAGCCWTSEMVESVRHITEKIVLLCATDSSFATMSPSLIASAAILSALQHGNVGGHPKNKPLKPSWINLNQVTAKLKDVARFEMVSK